MEEGLGELGLAKDPVIIKAAQTMIGKLDVLVCGQCHAAFHFVEEFNDHKSECTNESSLPKSCETEDKAQIWAFCLWKNKESRVSTVDNTLSSWAVYQKWCKLPDEERNMWVTSGQTLLSLNKIRVAKMQEVKFKTKREELKDQSGQDSKGSGDLTKALKFNSEISIVPSNKKLQRKDELQEFVVEAILGKRFNTRKKQWEYKVKWENFDEGQASWEPVDNMVSCNDLITEFEEKLKREKIKNESPKKEDTYDMLSGSRPQRNSKKKALNQVKQWIGSISDNEDSKRSLEDMDSDDSFEKKIKMEVESEDTDDEDKSMGHKKIYKSKSITNGIGKKLPDNVLIPDAQGIVRINQKQLPSLSSGVYIMSKTAGIIKLDSKASKIAASGGQAVVKVTPKIGQTHIKIVKKDGTKTIVSESKSKYSPNSGHKNKMMRYASNKNLKDNDKGLSDFKDNSRFDDDSDGLEELEFPTDLPPPEPDSPQPEDFVLDPETGKIAGVEYPEESEVIINQEVNAENTLDNIVKLAAADITEADLKPDPLPESNMLHNQDSNEAVIKSEAMEVSEDGQMQQIITLQKPRHIQTVKAHPEIRKDKLPIPKPEVSLIRTVSGGQSTILERTLQSPRTFPKSPGQRILNQNVKVSPIVRTVVRSGAQHVPMKAKAKLPSQRLYMSSPTSRFNEGIIKQHYVKQVGLNNRRIGNIGGTTIYRKPQSQMTYGRQQSPKVITRTNIVRKVPPQQHQSKQTTTTYYTRPGQGVTKVVSKPQRVISMPSLADEEPQQPAVAQIIASNDGTVAAEQAQTVTVAAPDGETDLSTFTLNDGEAPIFITGDDGTVYQVAGQNEQGQTILITQGPDGQQQCLLVTNEAAQQEESTAPETVVAEAAATSVEDQAQVSIAVSEAMEDAVSADQNIEGQGLDLPILEGEQAEQVQSLTEPLSVKTEPEATDQVVAQVVRAEPPSPGGTHKVVVMLPDGKLMVTQVTPEEYASLELDK